MKTADRIYRRYLNLTPKEKNDFLQMAGLQEMPGHKHLELIKKLKPMKPKSVGKKKPTRPAETININLLSFEERIKFIEDEGEGRFKKKHSPKGE